jgi:hypothetical protein
MAELYITDDGACLLGGQPLHPPSMAMQAAAHEMAGILAGAGPSDTLVLAGSGLGWHAKAVLVQPKGPQLVIYETDAYRIAMARSLGPDLTGAKFVQNDEELVEALAERLVYGTNGVRPGRVAVYAPEAYRLAEPDLAGQAKSIAKQIVSRSSIDYQTRASKRSEWLNNLRINFKYILQCPDLTRLVNKFKGVPALVIGAGPSLDTSLEAMARLENKALLVAAASAIGPMAQSGMAPHFAVALEAKDESRQFRSADFNVTRLAAASSGHTNHFSKWPDKSSLIHLQPWAAKLSGGGLGLPNGGHATSAAFSLAVLWGCDPIILVGQDLAYSGGKIHASNRPGGEDEKRPELIDIPAIGGGLTKTSAVFMSYINWYQETAAYLARTGGRARVINATAQGAHLSGFEHMLLEDVLASLPEIQIQSSDLDRLVDKIPMPTASEVVQNVAAAGALVRRCMIALEQGGVQAALAAAGKDTAASAALEFLGPDTDIGEATERLQEMTQTLRAMAEEMYA